MQLTSLWAKALASGALLICSTSCNMAKLPEQSPKPKPIDDSLTPETLALFHSIHRIGWDPDKIIFGQEFPLSYSSPDNFGNGDIDQSDVKDAVGDHPGLHGADFVYMIDQPWHQDFHKAAAKRAYESGAIVTFDYHWNGKYGGHYGSQVDDDKILDYVVRNDDSRGDVTWFYANLDRILAIINEDLQIPIIFRPFHEMNGDWFWWGRQMQGGSETYREAFRLLVDYIRERSDLVLFCWSPDKGLFTEYYPGDDYVDMIGMDIYDIGSRKSVTPAKAVSWLEDAVDFAAERGKVAAFTETGDRVLYPEKRPRWWTEQVLEPILASEKARNVAWILTWINAEWSGPYTPIVDSPEESKADFKKFYEHPVTLFQTEVAAEKVYESLGED